MTAEVVIRVLKKNPIVREDLTIMVPDYTGREADRVLSKADIKVFDKVGIGFIETGPAVTFVRFGFSKIGRLWLLEDRTTIGYGVDTEVDLYGTNSAGIPDGVTLSYELYDARKKYAVPAVVVEVRHIREK